uniref:Ig-like domain-containing protein n=1 Tax=Labrus bergylta TaxID=56723 RepID=A0A3Q3GV38_9LABR
MQFRSRKVRQSNGRCCWKKSVLRAQLSAFRLMNWTYFLTDRAVPPSFTKSLKKVDGSVGSNVTLECRVAGSQPMIVSWYKDDKEIHSDGKYKIDVSESTASVTVTGLEQTDGGVYKCRASNDAGEKETSGTLSVRGQRCYVT